MHSGRTVEELAQALHVTRTAITSQLAALQAAGLVTQQGLRPGRRRPSVVYMLSTSADAFLTRTRCMRQGDPFSDYVITTAR